MADPLLDVRELSVDYQLADRRLAALSEVSFRLAPGEILGVAGESGCGKSTLGLAIIGLLPDVGHSSGGEIIFQGRDLLHLSEKQMDQEIRGARMTMIFQNPQSALNPVFRIESQMIDILRAQNSHNNKPSVKRSMLRTQAIRQFNSSADIEYLSLINTLEKQQKLTTNTAVKLVTTQPYQSTNK